VWFCDNAHPDHATAHGPPAYRDRADEMCFSLLGNRTRMHQASIK
jgi:hypothetical protein